MMNEIPKQNSKQTTKPRKLVTKDRLQSIDTQTKTVRSKLCVHFKEYEKWSLSLFGAYEHCAHHSLWIFLLNEIESERGAEIEHNEILFNNFI